MNSYKIVTKPLMWFMALLLVAVAAGCSSGSSSGGGAAANSAKDITAYSLGGTIGTINQVTKTITVARPTGTPVTDLVATFVTSGASVKVGTSPQTSGVTFNNFTSPVVYTVTAIDGTSVNYTVTVNVAVAGAAVVCTGTVTDCVNLGTAANYVIFGKTGVTNVPTSTETGNIGSAAAATAITGFVKTLDSSGVFSTDPQVTGKIYAVDYAVPTPSDVGTASDNMLTAYTAALGKTPAAACPGAITAGQFDNGLIIAPGIYGCGGVTIPAGTVTLNGPSTAVWVFQLSGTLTQTSGTKVLLTGGALPQNVFWAVAGAVQIGTTATMEGVILGATNIDVLAGATVHGRLLAQTAVNLQGGTNTVAQPVP